MDQPTVEDTISILRGLKERYEVHHGVRIKDAALVAAAVLSQPLHHRPLPARQGHRPGGRSRRAPAHRDRLHARGARRDHAPRHAAGDRARGAAARRPTRPPRERLAKLEKELADLHAEADALKAHWQAEKQAVQRLRSLREQIEQTKVEIEQAERQYDLNRAAELKYGKLPELERKLQAGVRQASARSRAARRSSRRRWTRRTSPRS